MYSETEDSKIYDQADIAFKTPFTMNIIGPSKCGKTSLVSDLLEYNGTIMSPAPQRIIYCYSLYQPLFNYLK
jgi:hypothetical protein